MQFGKNTPFVSALSFAAALAVLPSCSSDSGLNGASASSADKNKAGKDKGGKDPLGKDGQNGSGNGNVLGDDRAGGQGGLDDAGSGVRKETLPDGRIRLTLTGKITQGVASVDIVFALDTSGSMGEEKTALETNIAGFVNQLTTAGKDIDYRVWMIASGFTFPSVDPARFEIVPRKVESNDALQIIKEFVTGTLAVPVPPATGIATGTATSTSTGTTTPPIPSPPRKLRENSLKQFVVVTDDNAKGILATDFLSLEATNPLLTNKTSFNGVIGLKQGKISPTCNIAAVGTEYQTLASSPQTKGLIQDLCASDWNKLLETLAKKIVTEAQVREFSLDKIAEKVSLIDVEVGGRSIAASGYAYDPAKNTITLTPENAPRKDEILIITYTPKKDP